MKPKRYPYSGNKKQPEKQIAIKVNELKADVDSVASRTNQVFSRIVGDTKISVNCNGVELEAPKIVIKSLSIYYLVTDSEIAPNYDSKGWSTTLPTIADKEQQFVWCYSVLNGERSGIRLCFKK
ncbi:MAG: hypothetical protein V8T39_06355 [Streptococcus lutetiensis]